MKKFHKLTAASYAAFLLVIPFGAVAYAGGGEEIIEVAVESSVPAET